MESSGRICFGVRAAVHRGDRDETLDMGKKTGTEATEDVTTRK